MTKQAQQQSKWQIPFFTIWTGQAFSLVGSSLVQFTLVWWLTETTDSATVLALASMMAILPGVLIGPFAGALVDRWNRRLTMIIADGVIALAIIGLAALFYLDMVQPWHIYAIMFIRAAVGAFHWPAMRASTSLMVPQEHLSRAAGLNQMLRGVMSIATPPIAALLLNLLPLSSIIAIDVVTAVVAMGCLFFVHIPQPERPAAATVSEKKPSLFQDMAAGFRYMMSWPGLLALAGIAVLCNFLLSPVSSLMPLLITDHFGGTAIHLAWFQSGFGFGIIVGGLVLSVWGGFRRRILTALMGIVGIGAGILLIGLMPPSGFWLAVGCAAFAGVMQPIANGTIHAVLQAQVAPEMQGRVFTTVGSVASAMSPLGLAIAGPVADWLGVPFWYVATGIICTVVGIVAFFVPVVTRIEENNTGREVAVKETATAEKIPA